MRVPRSVVVLRLACILAMLASAALIVDGLHVGRGMCPVEGACERVASSALGTVLGVKTSVLGLGAFSVLLVLTLLPAAAARLLARPAAWAGTLAALVFVGYQAFVLHQFCPLCLVADASALAAGAAAFTWPKAPIYRSKKKARPTESIPARLRWAFAAQVVVAVPFLWPAAPKKPSWVELPRSAASIDVAAEFAPYMAPDGAVPSETFPVPGEEPRTAPPPSPVPDLPATPVPPPPGLASADLVPVAPRPVATPSAPPPRPVRAPTPAPVAPSPAIVAPRPAVREIVVMEYVNAFCSHCRLTHQRLDTVVAGFGRPVRRHRVYAWSSREAPLWAKACACAALQGREDAMWDALLETERQDDRSIRAAARRAGVDLNELDAPEVVARLERDHRLVAQAQLEGLPTFDVGRRRLMGEQSEDELLDALRVAVAD